MSWHAKATWAQWRQCHSDVLGVCSVPRPCLLSISTTMGFTYLHETDGDPSLFKCHSLCAAPPRAQQGHGRHGWSLEVLVPCCKGWKGFGYMGPAFVQVSVKLEAAMSARWGRTKETTAVNESRKPLWLFPQKTEQHGSTYALTMSYVYYQELYVDIVRDGHG